MQAAMTAAAAAVAAAAAFIRCCQPVELTELITSLVSGGLWPPLACMQSRQETLVDPAGQEYDSNKDPARDYLVVVTSGRVW
jgi:hypothetical protein